MNFDLEHLSFSETVSTTTDFQVEETQMSLI